MYNMYGYLSLYNDVFFESKRRSIAFVFCFLFCLGGLLLMNRFTVGTRYPQMAN